MAAQRPEVLISEVAPRDGLQSIQSIMPTAHKCQWIDALVRAGLREIEVGSFVSEKLLPQMADTGAVVAHSRQHSGLCVLALAPNLKGAQSALAAGVHKITVPISASEAHSLANVRKTIAEMLNELDQIIQTVQQHNATSGKPPVVVEVGISTAFGCTLAGRVSDTAVLTLANKCAAIGAQEVGLSDTTGMANPAQIKRLFTQLHHDLGDRAGAAHLHNTRGLGLANALAAYEAGVRTFDSSQGGIGGCPYAPGASGNIVTEDLIFMFEAMGVSTGVRFEQLLKARALLEEFLPDEPLYGMTPAAGLPKGFKWPATPTT
ncbi:MAG: hypothetical protein RIQ66_879 [Pseudomonadota bacterium]|jgi:hydroxymethylglutaryl-CoA lyase